MILNTSKIKLPGLWDEIRAYEGKKFLTKKGLPFTYSIKGGELFTDRRERSITRSTFERIRPARMRRKRLWDPRR